MRVSLAKDFVVAQAQIPSMNDKSKVESDETRQFEGVWLISPSGAVACAKTINGKLLIPYSHGNEGKLTGHYFDCHVIGTTLRARFSRFDSNDSGVLFLAIGANNTLHGGWWLDKDVSPAVRASVSNLSDSMSGMVKSVWVLMPKAKTPLWAEAYFQADPPWTAL